MIVFSALQVRYGVNVLLDKASATINPGQKVGIIGKNGCGKSTLLALLKGQMHSDEGSVSFPKNWSIAWVNQETPALSITAIEYVIDGDREYRQLEHRLAEANAKEDGIAIAEIHQQLETIQAATLYARAATLLAGLGFTQQQLYSPVSTFSGGWRMRLNLAQALICRSDLLLLDEPTNHLDLDAVIWLEKWLRHYPGTLLLISHDRDFLDPIINKVIHIEQKQLVEYSGNYSFFEQQRAAKLAQQNALYKHQQQKVAHLQSYIDRFKAKASKARQAQSRIKMLERMELIAPAHSDTPFTFTFKAAPTLPNPLLTLNKVSVGYGDKTILSDIKLHFVPGDRIGLLGRNGAGKSTLIKLLAGEITAKTGIFTLAKGIKLGYFAQHQLETLKADESPLQHLSRLSPQESEQTLRDYLGGFDFHGDKVKQPTRAFSGGEKARLVLALIVWQQPNVLLLDEPTNHLDLDMRQALTEALIDFAGALIIVSHDRHLLRATTDELYLVDRGHVTLFNDDLNGYQQWLSDQQKEEQAALYPPTSIQNPPIQQRKQQKRREAELRQKTQPLRKQLTDYEQQMEQLEKTLVHYEQRLADNDLYDKQRKDELTTVLQQQTAAKTELAMLEANWLTAQEQLDTLIAQLTAEDDNA